MAAEGDALPPATSPVALKAAIGVAIFLYVSVALSAFDVRVLGYKWDLQKLSSFSDSFGPLNTILAAAAALSAFAALRLQKAENFSLAERARAEQISSERRDFESTFFRLLELFRQTVAETSAKNPFVTEAYTGRAAFEMILEYLGNSSGDDETDRTRWKAVYIRYQPQLGHYFRLMYQIIRFIDDSRVDDKMLYIRALRATLSNAEIVLLGLNGWHGGYPKTKVYIERYSMLHNITASQAVSRRMNLYYNRSAFGNRDLMEEQKSHVSNE